MLLPIPDVLTADQVVRARQILDQADWVDGRVTAGHQSAKAKDNAQLPEDSPVSRQLGPMILSADLLLLAAWFVLSISQYRPKSNQGCLGRARTIE